MSKIYKCDKCRSLSYCNSCDCDEWESSTFIADTSDRQRVSALEQENERLRLENKQNKKQIYYMRNCANCENVKCDAKLGKFVNYCFSNNRAYWTLSEKYERHDFECKDCLELKTDSTFEISPCAGCWSMENGCGPTVDCETCTVKIGKPSNWKASSKYDDIRKLSEKDCNEIFDYAMQRSKEVLGEKDE